LRGLGHRAATRGLIGLYLRLQLVNKLYRSEGANGGPEGPPYIWLNTRGLGEWRT